MAVTILDKCTGCGSCIAVCPRSALTLETEFPNGFGNKVTVVDKQLCDDCGICVSACPHQALETHQKTN
ncbi:MAG: 4Fe-4S binding protein [Desulfuromusa sp.]|nr:4Fe-4S binding protein [Desulfuromusa sp.]